MEIILCTLVLNEMEWLPKLYEQHKDWPNLIKWIFVESADFMYAKANPDLVTADGLSTDGTYDYLLKLARTDGRVSHVPHGISSHTDIAQGKIDSRNRYMRRMDNYNPDFFFILDADEFYTKHDQQHINCILNKAPNHIQAFLFKHHDVWRPHSIAHEPLFQHEAVGGYFAMHHYRGWRWREGLRYSVNHNHPSDHIGPIIRNKQHFDKIDGAPVCVHMGFAANHQARAAKNKYYIQRGEGRDDGRQKYVDCRAAFETWHPGDKLPHGAKIIPYTGPIPEVFRA